MQTYRYDKVFDDAEGAYHYEYVDLASDRRKAVRDDKPGLLAWLTENVPQEVAFVPPPPAPVQTPEDQRLAALTLACDPQAVTVAVLEAHLGDTGKLDALAAAWQAIKDDIPL